MKKHARKPRSVAYDNPGAYLGSMAGMILVRPGIFTTPKGDTGRSMALIANGLDQVATLRRAGKLTAAKGMIGHARSERSFLRGGSSFWAVS